MLKRSLALVAVLALGLFGCEVQNDEDGSTTEDVAEDGVGTDTTPVDPCATDQICSPECALAGTFDADCYVDVEEECLSFEDILSDWFNNSSLKDKMSPTTRNCDWTPGKCDAQFKCDDQVTAPRPCFCDPACYTTEAGVPTGLIDPCGEDGHCDSWCPKDGDADCAGLPDNGIKCDE